MDGWYLLPGSNDVLQAGVNISACPVSHTAWYEWWVNGCSSVYIPNPLQQPCYQTNVNLPVHPGDYMYISVTYYSSSPRGSAFISNQTTGQYVSVSFDQPPPNNTSTQYAGASAEWIVERPAFGGVDANYANYIGYGGPSGTDLYLGSDYSDNNYLPSGAWALGYGPENVITVIDTTCPVWKPSSNCSSGTHLSNTQYFPSYPYSGWYGIFNHPVGPVLTQ